MPGIFELLAAQKGFAPGTGEYDEFVGQLQGLGVSDAVIPATRKVRKSFSVKGLINTTIEENGDGVKEYLLATSLIGKIRLSKPDVSLTIADGSLADIFLQSLLDSAEDDAAREVLLVAAITELSKKSRNRGNKENSGVEVQVPETVEPETKSATSKRSRTKAVAESDSPFDNVEELEPVA